MCECLCLKTHLFSNSCQLYIIIISTLNYYYIFILCNLMLLGFIEPDVVAFKAVAVYKSY